MDSFDARLATAVKDQVLPGVIALARNSSGTLNYTKHVGENYSPSTVLELYSATKLVTTIAALQLVEQGRVTLDEDVSALVPNLASQPIIRGFVVVADSENDKGQAAAATGTAVQFKLEPRRNPITLRQLLTHSSGAGYVPMDENLIRYRTNVQQKGPLAGATVDERFDHPLLYEPGQGWAYGSGIDRAGQVVEALLARASTSGDDRPSASLSKSASLSLGDFLQDHVFRPLGITTATFPAEAAAAAAPTDDGRRHRREVPMMFRDVATGRAVEAPGQVPPLNEGLEGCFGGQGLWMSAEDYMKILESLLRDDEKLLRRETAAMMFRPQLSPASREALVKKVGTTSWMVGEYPPTGEYDWGLGGLLVDGVRDPIRKDKTLIWWGISSVFWFVDREAGVAGIWATQVLQPCDAQINSLISAFEEDVRKAALGS